VHIFKRVFDRDYMLCLVLINVIQDRGQSSRLTTTCSTCKDNKPPLLVCYFLKHTGQPQSVKVSYTIRDHSDRGRYGASLKIHVHPEPRSAGNTVGEVHFKRILKRLLLLLIHHRVDEVINVFSREHRGAFYGKELTLYPETGHSFRAQVYI